MKRRLPLVILVAVAACSSGGDDSNRPEILAFTAEALLVEPGAKTTLSWNVARAAKVSIAPQGRSNLVTDSPKPEGSIETNAIDDHTVFTLRAEGLDGSTVGASVLVRVNFPAPVVDDFAVSPDTVREGDRVLLRWATTHATEVHIEDGDGELVVEAGSPDDTTPATPDGSQTYTLTARGPGGEVTATAAVTVRGAPPAIVEFEARPATIFPGESSTLAWEVLGATRVRIRSAGGEDVFDGPDLSGTRTVMPSASEMYFLAASNPNGTTSATVTVSLDEPRAPSIDVFDATPNPAAIGDRTTLRWRAPGARRVAVSRGGMPVVEVTEDASEGTVDVTVTSTQARYTLVASNDFGDNTQSFELYGHVAPQVSIFTVTPLLFTGSASMTLEYAVKDVAKLDLVANGAPVPGFVPFDRNTSVIDAGDILTFTSSVTTAYELLAESAAGTERQLLTAVNGIAEVEPNDTSASPMGPIGSGDVSAALAGTDDVDVYAVDVAIAGASLYAETSNGPGACEIDTQITLFDTDGLTPLVFDDDDGTGTCSRIDPDVDLLATGLAPGRYFVQVDSGGAGAGAYVLSVDVRGAVCGNGAVESAEECDDGNTAGGDGCSATCTYELSPTVIVAPGGVATVTIPTNQAFAVVAVELDRPGQSIAARAAEPGDACDVVDTAIALYDASLALLGAKTGGGPTGTAGTCGAIRFPNDGFATNLAQERHLLVVRPEGPNGGSVEVTVTIRNPACGNGVIESRASEQCDDNNTASGDGCDNMCRLESGLVPEVEPNGTQATANATGLLGAGTVDVQGANSPAGDDDVYAFTVPAGQTLRLSARTYSTPGQPTSCDASTTDTRIFLEAAGTEVTAPGMGELAYNDDIDNANNVWCSGLTNVPLTGGAGGTTYYLRVQGWLDMQTTSYLLTLSLAP